MKYIQFIGTQRSGSNLLRVMLNQVPEIAAPHPPHILKTFYPLLNFYGDLKYKDNFRSLVVDVCDWVNKNPVPWEDCFIDFEKTLSMCTQQTLIELFIRIYEQKAEHDGAQYWCCKSMESIYYVKEIEDAGLRPLYIYIYRDGRDVALSFKKAIVGPKHIYHLAKKWLKEQELSLDWLNTLDEDRYIIVRYEELIAHPKITMQVICDKLNIPFTENIFDYFHSHESFATAHSGAMWKNLTKPIIADNYNKFKKELSAEDIQLFERVAGKMLERLKYKADFWPSVKSSKFLPDEIAIFDVENEKLKKLAIASASKEELSRRRPQEELIKEIKTRMIKTI